MKKLIFDSGVEEFRIPGGGVLRFNPGDPNLYSRFAEAAQKLAEIEAALAERAQQEPVLELLAQADRQIKQLLNWVFGGDNDFHKALGGVSLLAPTSNGQTVAANLFAALEQVLSRGAQALVEAKVAQL